MADSNSLKVMSIFEVGARLDYGSELTCLAAHIYHRFFRVQQQTSMFDLYMFASASLLVAHWFYEKTLVPYDLYLVMCDILHGQDFFITEEITKNLTHSMELAAKIICTNLDYQVSFKDTRLTTPGLLREQYRSREAEIAAQAKNNTIIDLVDSEEKSSSSSEDEDTNETKADRLLTKNDRNKISSHRYLVHYLKIIKSLVHEDVMDYFEKISNVAWVFLCDYHWSPCVTQILSNHLACACLMMAIEVFRPQLEDSKVKERAELWKTLDKKWNHILCEDLNEKQLKRAIDLIVDQYEEYSRVVQYELNTYVIDPLRH
jgi:hypothetical protein